MKKTIDPANQPTISIEFPGDGLAAAVAAARNDLLHFLAALDAWARSLAPEQAQSFVARIDRALAITEPQC
jgi:hypothetical protein